MDPIVTAALAQGGAQAGAGTLGVFTQAAQNRKSRQFSREMYQRQFDDNIRLWEMQNEYNSPARQMERLKDAGLNPAMMYGKGASAGLASTPKSPEVKSAQFQAPDWSPIGDAVGNSIDKYFDTKIKKAQHDNLQVINTGKNIANAIDMLKLEKSKFDLPYLKEMTKVSLDAAKTSLEKTLTEMQVLVNRDIREAAQSAQTIAESVARVEEISVRKAKTKQERENLKQNFRILKKNADLFENWNIRPTDPIWMKWLAEFLEKAKGDLPVFNLPELPSGVIKPMR